MAQSRRLSIVDRRVIGVAALLSLAVLVTALSGCGDTACFQWGAEEGACPAQVDAKTFMTPQNPLGGDACNSVLSVDSDGEFDGTSCCYDVTETENQYCY